jgi:Zn finger protein HypA/HybF involved in hydrogenase expression
MSLNLIPVAILIILISVFLVDSVAHYIVTKKIIYACGKCGLLVPLENRFFLFSPIRCPTCREKMRFFKNKDLVIECPNGHKIYKRKKVVDTCPKCGAEIAPEILAKMEELKKASDADATSYFA